MTSFEFLSNECRHYLLYSMCPLGLISYFARSATLSLSSPPDMDRWFKDIQAKGVPDGPRRASAGVLKLVAADADVDAAGDVVNGKYASF